MPPSPRSVRLVSTPAEPAQVLPENYTLTVTVKEKERLLGDLSVVSGAREFSAVCLQRNSTQLQFKGSLQPEEDGSVVVSYVLETQLQISAVGEAGQNQTMNANGSVRLRLGETVPVLTSNGIIYQLAIVKTAGKEAAPK